MPTLSALKTITATATVDFYGVKVAVKYRPAAMTLRLERELFDQGEDESAGQGRDRVARAFLQIIAEWDVTGEDGEPIPVSAESLEEVPRDVLWEVLRQLSNREAASKNGGGK